MTTTPTEWLAAVRVNIADAPPPEGHPSGTNYQHAAAVVALTNGNYLVVWEDWSSTFDYGLEPSAIAGQIYTAAGVKVGNEIGLNAIYQDLAQGAPAITALPGGGFAVAQQTSDATGAFGFDDRENITVEIFDATGAYVRDTDFRQGPGGPAGIDDVAPTISAFADGSYVVAFANNADGNFDIDAYVVDNTGIAGAAIAIETGAGDASAAASAILSNGNFVIAYQVANTGDDVGFAIRTAAGGVVANGTVAGGAGHQRTPAVAALKDGGFVVAWFDNTADGAGNPGVRFRIYDNAGNGGAVLSANTLTPGVQDSPAITALADGGFVVAWRDAADTSLQGARFDAAGAAVGAQFTLSNVANDSEPALALLNDGRFVAAYTMTNAGGNAQIYQTIFDPRTGPIQGTNAGETILGRRDGAELQGLGGSDTLVGYDGNDTLNGGTAADDMRGGKGNDTYYVSVASDTIVEKPGEGIDTVYTTVNNLTLGAQLENLILQAGVARGRGNSLDNTLTGNTLANILQGYDGDDTILGGDGADELRGMEGADSMVGGNGSDTYFVDDAGDVVVETSASLATGGSDTVYSFLSLTLGANVENLRLQGTSGLSGTGNELANRLYGNDGANLLQGLAEADTIEGGAGNDTISGGAGNDRMKGGTGADTFRFAASGTGSDRISDFNIAQDRFQLSGGTFSEASIDGTDTVLKHAGGTVRIQGIADDNLATWNALVDPGGESLGGFAAIAWNDDAAHPGRALLPTGGDWLYA